MTVHWNRIYQQLETARRNSEAGFLMDEAAMQQQLKARADLLARRPPQTDDTGNHLEILTFWLGDEAFAVDLSYIQTVVPSTKITPIPCTPSFIQGIAHVHGQLYSVINLKNLFKITGSTALNTQPIIILQSPGAETAAIAIDAIMTMRSIALADIQPALPVGHSVRVDYIQGITNDPLVIIDAARILADERLIVDEDIAD